MIITIILILIAIICFILSIRHKSEGIASAGNILLIISIVGIISELESQGYQHNILGVIGFLWIMMNLIIHFLICHISDNGLTFFDKDTTTKEKILLSILSFFIFFILMGGVCIGGIIMSLGFMVIGSIILFIGLLCFMGAILLCICEMRKG